MDEPLMTTKWAYNSTLCAHNPPIIPLKIPRNPALSRIRLRVSSSSVCRANVGLDLGGVYREGSEEDGNVILVDVWSETIHLTPGSGLVDDTAKRNQMCERRFRVNVSAAGGNGVLYRSREAVHDSTLGGRTWDAACVLSSILTLIISRETSGNSNVVWEQRVVEDYKGHTLTRAGSWSEVEGIRKDKELLRIDKDMSLMVSRALMDARDGDRRPRRILEVGCGGGLTGTVMAHQLLKACTAEVPIDVDILLTDLPEIIPFAADNLRINPFPESDQDAGRLRVGVGALDWFSEDSASVVSQVWSDSIIVNPILQGRCHDERSAEETTTVDPFDVIIAADVAYNTATHQVLIDTLTAVSGRETLVLLAYKPRYPETEATFFALAKTCGWRAVGVLGRGFNVHVFILKQAMRTGAIG